MTVTPDAITALLVDDHAVVLEGLQRALERAGIDVVGKTSQVDVALRLAAEHQPTLCLVDLRLREGSGVDLLPRLLDVSDTRVVMLTSFDDGRAARDAMARGAAGFLLKDHDPAELCALLRSIAGGATILDERVSAAVFRPSVELSDVDIQLLHEVMRGATNAEAGAAVHLSAHTVKDHLAAIMRTLGARTRTEAVARAVAEGLITPDRS